MIFNIVLKDGKKLAKIVSFNYDEAVVSEPEDALRTAITKYLLSNDYKEDKKYMDDITWNDIGHIVPDKYFEEEGLFPINTLSENFIVDGNASLTSIDGNNGSRSKVNIYTDGSCAGNPGPGGWAAVILCDGSELVVSGGENQTTNNRMELSALIGALEKLKKPCDILIHSDSKYIIDSLAKGWVYKWRDRGWVNSSGSDTPNVDLWEKLLALMEMHKCEFEWVKGHNGNPYNEKCDAIAGREARARS